MVYIDTNILIYLLENYTKYSKQVSTKLEEIKNNDEKLITSVITISEYTAGSGDIDLNELLQFPNLEYINVNREVAIYAGYLQKNLNLKIGDAIHLATARIYKADKIFTNDSGLIDASKNELKIIRLK